MTKYNHDINYYYKSWKWTVLSIPQAIYGTTLLFSISKLQSSFENMGILK